MRSVFVIPSRLLQLFLSSPLQLAVKVEETQGQFDWRTLHHVVFRHVPEHQRPSENRLHLLMALVAKVSVFFVWCGGVLLFCVSWSAVLLTGQLFSVHSSLIHVLCTP